MSWKLLSPLIYGFLLLVVVEFGLEYRAHKRGYATILFPPPQSNNSSSTQQIYGPVEHFPFRSKIVRQTKPPGFKRIWVASASHAEDQRQPADVIFPVVLQEYLNADHTPCQILNASRAGLSISNNTKELRERADEWDPDIVILYQMAIDIKLLSQLFAGSSDFANSEIDSEVDTPESHSLFYWLGNVTEQTTLYTLVKTNLTSRITAARQLSESLDPNAETQFEMLINGFVDEAENSGTIPVLCTFAISHDSTTKDQMPADYELGMLRQNPYLSMSGWRVVVSSFNSAIRAIAKKRGVLIVDLEKRIGGQPQYFRDIVHFSKVGHAEVAMVIKERLLAAGVLGREATP